MDEHAAADGGAAGRGHECRWAGREVVEDGDASTRPDVVAYPPTSHLPS